MNKPNPADAHLALIIECFGEGMDTARTAEHLREWHSINLSQADVANTLAKFRDNLSAQTETRLAAGF